MQPTFLRMFADDQERGTEYIAIETITRATVEKKPREKGGMETNLVISTLEGATRVIGGVEAQELIKTLDTLSPAPSSPVK